MRWSFFLGACALAWCLLLWNGAPLPAVATGTLLAGFLNLRKHGRRQDGRRL